MFQSGEKCDRIKVLLLKMKIYIASDHTGFEIKEKVKKYLGDRQYPVQDCGAFRVDPDDDYPQYIHTAAKYVGANPDIDRGIIFGGSGQGEAIVANKTKGVRCGLIYAPVSGERAINIEGVKSDNPLVIVDLIREHNDANMISFGVRFLAEEEILRAIDVWLQAKGPVHERHIRRVNQIKEIENEK